MGHKTMGYPRVQTEVVCLLYDLFFFILLLLLFLLCVIGISFLRARHVDLSLLFWFLLIFRTMRGIVLETNNIMYSIVCVDSHFIAQGLK